jgi:hypothetical protein
MIKYALRCDQSHVFESWFPNSQSFEDQKSSGLVGCPECGSTQVGKALMAPAVVTSRKRAAVQPTAPNSATESAATPEPVALVDDAAVKVRAMMRELRDHLVKNSHDVGAAFADEARKIHEGVAEHRPIRGEASPEEVRSLVDDGIDIMPLPVFPEDRN